MNVLEVDWELFIKVGITVVLMLGISIWLMWDNEDE